MTGTASDAVAAADAAGSQAIAGVPVPGAGGAGSAGGPPGSDKDTL